MKYYYVILLSLVFSHSAFAANLCDPSCELEITFPDGGSIQATEALTIEFGLGGVLELGETGTVNTNPQPLSINFSAGGSLSLAEGDSITFDNNGRLDLGASGNIIHTLLSITTTGSINVTAAGIASSISMENIDLPIEATLLLDAEAISVSGNFTQLAGSIVSSAELTSTLLELFGDGISLPTQDGISCTMLGGVCLSATGQKYVVVDGELVPENNGSGAFSPIMLLLSGVFLLFRSRRFYKLAV